MMHLLNMLISKQYLGGQENRIEKDEEAPHPQGNISNDITNRCALCNCLFGSHCSDIVFWLERLD